MEQKASEKGLKSCNNCGTPDIFFALSGKCVECQSPIERNSKQKTFQFALEVFTEFAEKFDDFDNSDRKRNSINILKNIISKCKIENRLPQFKELFHIQALVNNVTIGGEKIGGAITVTEGKPSVQLLQENNKVRMDSVQSLAAIVMAIQYIQEFRVESENFTLTSDVPREKSNIPSPESNSGCIVLLLALISSLMSFAFIVSYIYIYFKNIHIT